jgi:hypothetical protein
MSGSGSDERRRDARVGRKQEESTYLGDVLDDDILKVPLPSKELGEILALGFGPDGTPNTIPCLEECPDGLAEGS